MSTKRRQPRSPLSPQARLLFTQLEHQYADATAQEWDELREHFDGQLAALAGGSDQRRRVLEETFDATRSATLAGLAGRRVLAQLADGAAVLVRDRGDGLEEWQIPADDDDATPVLLFIPTEDGTAAAQVARTAALSGRCPSCRSRAVVVAGTAEVTHNSRCPARAALDW